MPEGGKNHRMRWIDRNDILVLKQFCIQTKIIHVVHTENRLKIENRVYSDDVCMVKINTSSQTNDLGAKYICAAEDHTDTDKRHHTY